MNYILAQIEQAKSKHLTSLVHHHKIKINGDIDPEKIKSELAKLKYRVQYNYDSGWATEDEDEGYIFYISWN